MSGAQEAWDNSGMGLNPEEDAARYARELIALFRSHPGNEQVIKAMDAVGAVARKGPNAEGTVPVEIEGFDNWHYEAVGQWAPTEWLIDGVLPDRCVTLFAGLGARGKTTLVMALVTAYALGLDKPWSHFAGAEPVPRLEKTGGRVVWATWETRPGDFQRRLYPAAGIQASDIQDLEILRGNLSYVNMRKQGPIWGPQHGEHVATRGALLPGGEALLEYAAKYKAKILVLDPLAAAYANSEIDRSLVRQFLTYLAQWADDQGCVIIILAHPPKSGDEGYSGTSDWDAGVQARWTLSRCGCEEYSRLTVAKVNEAKRLWSPFTFRWDDVLSTFSLDAVHECPEETNKKSGRSGGKNVLVQLQLE